MQIWLNDLEPAAKTLDYFACKLDELTGVQLYHYYYNQGNINSKKGCMEKALEFYLKVCEMRTDDVEQSVRLYYNIALCYERLGFISLATSYCETAFTLNALQKYAVPNLSILIRLGMNYAHIGILHRSKFFLDQALEVATKAYEANKNNDTKANMGSVYINYGILYRTAKNWNLALDYFYKALQYIEPGSEDAFRANYNIIRCSIGHRSYLAYRELLAEWIKRSKDNKDYSIMFESLQYMANPTTDSVELLEKKILPYLLKNNYVYSALDCGMFIRDFYINQKKGSQTKAYKAMKICHEIQCKMHEGGLVE